MSQGNLPTSVWFRLVTNLWTRLWIRYAGIGPAGRIASRLALWGAPPHKARKYLARMTPRGFISPWATIYHSELRLGAHVFMDDRVLIYQRERGGAVEIGDGVAILRDTILETGFGGSIAIGSGTAIHPRCQINANVSPIQIGSGVGIGPNCALYSYDHGMAPGEDIFRQKLESKGPVIIGDGAWLGVGVIVVSGVRVGAGAVIGAGAVVTQDIPDGAIAAGVPARVVKMREELKPAELEAVSQEGGQPR